MVLCALPLQIVLKAPRPPRAASRNAARFSFLLVRRPAREKKAFDVLHKFAGAAAAREAAAAVQAHCRAGPDLACSSREQHLPPRPAGNGQAPAAQRTVNTGSRVKLTDIGGCGSAEQSRSKHVATSTAAAAAGPGHQAGDTASALAPHPAAGADNGAARASSEAVHDAQHDCAAVALALATAVASQAGELPAEAAPEPPCMENGNGAVHWSEGFWSDWPLPWAEAAAAAPAQPATRRWIEYERHVRHGGDDDDWLGF